MGKSISKGFDRHALPSSACSGPFDATTSKAHRDFPPPALILLMQEDIGDQDGPKGSDRNSVCDLKCLPHTAGQMTHATDWFEILSYALVTAVGAWLVWTKLFRREHHLASDGHHRHHAHGHDHGGRSHVHDHGHAHHHHDDGQCDCGHSHVPDPRMLKKPLSVSHAWAATLSVGIRPCSGAIIILVFALSQNLLIAGIGSVFAMSLGTFITVSTLATLAVAAKDAALRIVAFESRNAERVMRVVEIGGALVVLLLGLTLLGSALQGGFPA